MPKTGSDILGHLRIKSAPIKVTSLTAATRSALLPKGLYSITCDQDCHILQGDVTVTADANDAPLWQKERGLVRVRRSNNDGDGYISVIRDSADGTLWIIPLDA
jgi:hypothetical protein